MGNETLSTCERKIHLHTLHRKTPLNLSSSYEIFSGFELELEFEQEKMLV
jgi:hypothetical protein